MKWRHKLLYRPLTWNYIKTRVVELVGLKHKYEYVRYWRIWGSYSRSCESYILLGYDAVQSVYEATFRKTYSLHNSFQGKQVPATCLHSSLFSGWFSIVKMEVIHSSEALVHKRTKTKTKTNSVVWVHERQPLVSEVSANILRMEGATWSADGSLRPYSPHSEPEPLLFQVAPHL
jgi:hypothetical protein